MKNKEITKKAHNAIAGTYYELYKDDVSNLKYFDAFLKSCKPKIIDLGCGMGHYSGYMAEQGFNVTGVDFSENMLKIAKKNYPKVKFIISDVCKLDSLMGEKFDAVVLTYVLQYLSKKEASKLISNLKKSLNKNARMLLFVREGNSVVEEVEPINPEFKYEINEYSKDEIIDLLAKNGWMVELLEQKEEAYSPAPKTLIVIANRKK